MDIYQITTIIILFIMIVLSSLFSSAETAFMSVSKIRIRTIAEDDDDPMQAKAKAVLKLQADQDRLLSSILVGNNIVNLGASSLTTSLVLSLLGNQGAGVAVSTGIITLIILIFGEITPKTKASNDAEAFCFRYVHMLEVVNVVFYPVVVLLTALSHTLIKLTGGSLESGPTMTEEELKTIVDVSHEEGVLEDDEKEMLHNVFEFSDTEIREIMTPRIHAQTVSYDISYEDLLSAVREGSFSRIPVHSEDQDEIIGVLNIKDLMMKDLNEEFFDITEYMREPFFVYEFNNISAVFNNMRKSHTTLAIVLDEYGVMSGLVTLEDIVEEIVGEIDDEFDEDHENKFFQINDHEYLLDGSLNIDEINEHCGTSFDTENFESIGGLVLGTVNDVPVIHTQVVIDGCRLTIEKVDKNRIVRLKLEIPSSDDEA